MESTAATPKSSSFAGDVFKLVSGTTIAQGLMVLASPFLARLYTPEDFGTLAIYLSITSIVGVIACLRYELAIMLPESDEEAANLLAVSLGFSLIVTCLTTLAIGWGGETLLGWLNAPGLKPYLWLIPVTVLLDGVFQALNYWNSRTKQFGRLSIARVTSSAATVSTQLGAGYAGYATGGSLIGANVVGKTISTAVLGGQIWRDDRKTFWKAIRWRGMKRGMRRYKKFPMISTWSSLLNSTSTQLPTLLLSAFFSSSVVGFYSIAFRLLSMPMSLIGAAIGQVFFQRAAVAKLEGNLSIIVENTLQRLLLIGLLPIILVVLIGKDIFTFFLGESWSEAGLYAQILGSWLLFVFISSPISTLNSIVERQGLDLLFNAMIIVCRIFSLVIGGMYKNEYMALTLYSLSGTFLWFLLTIWFVNLSNAKFSRIIYNITLPLLNCFMIALVISFLKFCLHFNPFILVISSCTFLLIYYFFNVFYSSRANSIFDMIFHN